MAKADEWSYEREWRMIEYDSKSYYFRKAWNAIHLGKNCPPKVKENILQWAKKNDKEVYNVKASKTRYELERQRIV